MIRRIGGITRRRRLVFSVSASATAAAAASAYEPPVRRRRLDLQQYAAAVAPYGSSSRLALTRPPPSSLPFAGVAPLGSHPILIRSHSSSSSSDTRPSLQRRQPLPIATTSSFSPLGPLSSSQRGLVTKAQQPPPRSSGRLHSRVVRTDGRLPLQQMQRRGMERSIWEVLSSIAHLSVTQTLFNSGFWTPRFMRQIGVPWFVQVRCNRASADSNLHSFGIGSRHSTTKSKHTRALQVFYGTLLMVGLGVLAFAVFSASFIFGGLFLLAFAFFRLFAQRTFPVCDIPGYRLGGLRMYLSKPALSWMNRPAAGAAGDAWASSYAARCLFPPFFRHGLRRGDDGRPQERTVGG